MNSNGKKARKQHGGNRFDLKRQQKHHKRADKKFHDGSLTPEQYQALKAQKRRRGEQLV